MNQSKKVEWTKRGSGTYTPESSDSELMDELMEIGKCIKSENPIEVAKEENVVVQNNVKSSCFKNIFLKIDRAASQSKTIAPSKLQKTSCRSTRQRGKNIIFKFF